MQQQMEKKTKNGLPRGGVLAPLLFNVFTNNRLFSMNTRNVTYADDRDNLARNKKEVEVDEQLKNCKTELSEYYETNRLEANTGKTLRSLFHLSNRKSSQALELCRNDVIIEHDAGPNYFGVTLDRILNFENQSRTFLLTYILVKTCRQSWQIRGRELTLTKREPMHWQYVSQ